MSDTKKDYEFDLGEFLNIERTIFERFIPPVNKDSISYELDIIDKLYIMLLEEMEEIIDEHNSDNYNEINVVKEIADCICYSGTIMQYIKYWIDSSNIDIILNKVSNNIIQLEELYKSLTIRDDSDKSNILYISEDENTMFNNLSKLILACGKFTITVDECKDNFFTWVDLLNDYFRRKYIRIRMNIKERKWHKCYNRPNIREMDTTQLSFYFIPYINIYNLCQEYIIYLFNISLYHFGIDGKDLEKVIKEKQNGTLNIDKNDYK